MRLPSVQRRSRYKNKCTRESVTATTTRTLTRTYMYVWCISHVLHPARLPCHVAAAVDALSLSCTSPSADTCPCCLPWSPSRTYRPPPP